MVSCNFLHIMLYHDLNKLFETGRLRIPTKFLFRFGWITPKINNICGTIEVFANSNNNLTCRYIDSFLIDTFTFPPQFYSSIMERKSSKFTNSMLNTSRDNKILRFIML